MWRAKWTAKEYAEPEPNAVQRIRDFIRITYIDKRWYDASKQNMDSNTRMDSNTHQSHITHNQNNSNNHNNISNNQNNNRANPPATVNVCSPLNLYIINMLYLLFYIVYYILWDTLYRYIDAE